MIAFLKLSGRAHGPNGPGFTDRSPLVLCPAARVRQGDQGREGAVIGGYD